MSNVHVQRYDDGNWTLWETDSESLNFPNSDELITYLVLRLKEEKGNNES